MKVTHTIDFKQHLFIHIILKILLITTYVLQVSSLKGILVLNIPPPPSDRLWYSFKEKPELGLRIVPFYGGEKLGMDNTFFSRAINKIVNIVTHRFESFISRFRKINNCMHVIPLERSVLI